MSRQRHLRSNALGLAMLSLLIGGMLWSGLPNLPSLSSSVEMPHQAKPRCFSEIAPTGFVDQPVTVYVTSSRLSR